MLAAIGCREALRLCGAFLARAVRDAGATSTA